MRIQGLVAATFAPYNEDGSINFDMVPRLVDKLIADGLSGIYVCGTNGEGPNMSVAERMALAEAYVRAAAGRIIILVHVGHPAIVEARALAAHAAQIGADAISAVAAFYFKPHSVLNLVDCMAQIAAAAPDLPFYYYHMPMLTGVNFNMYDFLKASESKIPNLAGIKYTASTLHEYQACLNYKDGRFDILSGYDELLLPALSVGAKGAIGSTYTFAAPLYLEIVKEFRAGNIEKAAALQLKSVQFINCMTRYPAIAAQRAIMKMMGCDLGNPRLPLEALPNNQYEELQRALDGIGFFGMLEQYSQEEHPTYEKM